jgi:hypothetical protein
LFPTTISGAQDFTPAADEPFFPPTNFMSWLTSLNFRLLNCRGAARLLGGCWEFADTASVLSRFNVLTKMNYTKILEVFSFLIQNNKHFSYLVGFLVSPDCSKFLGTEFPSGTHFPYNTRPEHIQILADMWEHWLPPFDTLHGTTSKKKESTYSVDQFAR